MHDLDENNLIPRWLKNIKFIQKLSQIAAVSHEYSYDIKMKKIMLQYPYSSITHINCTEMIMIEFLVQTLCIEICLYPYIQEL